MTAANDVGDEIIVPDTLTVRLGPHLNESLIAFASPRSKLRALARLFPLGGSNANNLIIELITPGWIPPEPSFTTRFWLGDTPLVHMKGLLGPRVIIPAENLRSVEIRLAALAAATMPVVPKEHSELVPA